VIDTEIREVLSCLAGLLEYPTPGFAARAGDCAAKYERIGPRQSDGIRDFTGYVSGQPLETLEEEYTQTFDISPAASLYIGYHLFGDTPRRSVFLVELQEAFKKCDFSSGSELADHLSVLLRFLAQTGDPEFAVTLLKEGILPVTKQVEDELHKTDNRYAALVHSVRALLTHIEGSLEKAGGVQHA
jgi:nitrate reductase delta subunit